MEELPVLKRVSLTQEDVAVILANRKTDDTNDEYYDNLGEMLFESIRKMIYGLAHKYVWAFPSETVDDLANSCFYRIMDKLKLYDPECSRFTTWSYCVAQSVLNKKYQKQRRSNEIFCEADPEIDIEDDKPVRDGINEKQVAAFVLDFIKDFPEHSDILLAMFGDPEGPAFEVPNSFNMAEVARCTGLKYNEVRYFYARKIRPRMLKWLKEMNHGS